MTYSLKQLFFVFLFLTAAALFFAVGLAHAQTTGGCSGGTCTYVPLEPLPGVNQTGLNFSTYVSGMFRLFITLGALFAVLMLVLAGISWMTSESPLKLKAAQERATAALYGLLLLVACWLILYTINPNLLRFDLFTSTLNTAAQKNTAPNSTGGTPSGNTIYAAPRPNGAVGDSLLIMSPSSPEKLQQIKDFYNTCTNSLGGSDVQNVDAGSGATSFFCIR